MKKKNNFGMWLFSDSAMKFFNWLGILLIAFGLGYHIVRFIFRF